VKRKNISMEIRWAREIRGGVRGPTTLEGGGEKGRGHGVGTSTATSQLPEVGRDDHMEKYRRRGKKTGKKG